MWCPIEGREEEQSSQCLWVLGQHNAKVDFPFWIARGADDNFTDRLVHFGDISSSFSFPALFLKKRITVIQREKERLKKRTPRLILLLSHLSDSSSLARISSCVNVLLTRPHSWSSCYLLRLHGTDHFFFSLFFSLFLILLPDTKPPGHHCRHQWQYSNSVPKDMPTPQTVS